MSGDKTTEAMKFPVHSGPPPRSGETTLEREIPSDVALVTLLVIRVVDFLEQQTCIAPKDRNQIALCVEEALLNAVCHGNKKNFGKKVRLSVYRTEKEWGLLVSDEGDGFDPNKIRDPLGEDGIWSESGRGLYLMSHYMDRIEFYGGGRTILMARHL